MRNYRIGVVFVAGTRVRSASASGHALLTEYGIGLGGRTIASQDPGGRRKRRLADGGFSTHEHPTLPRTLDVFEHPLEEACSGQNDSTSLFVLVEHLEGERSIGSGDVLSVLSRREREIATLLATTGLPYAGIASKLGIQVGTLRTHVTRIYQRLNLASRPELVERLRDR